MGVMTIAEIRRHPVKGLGAEILGEAMLTRGRGLPGDRIYALADAAGAQAALAAAGAWAPCRSFVRPTTDPRLAQAQVVYDDATRWLIARHPDASKLVVDLAGASGGQALADWAAALVAPARGALTLVAARPERAGAAAHFADDAEPALSLMSTASLLALGDLAGRPLSPHRFRGNVWLSGGAPWEEESWAPGRRIRLGAATLEVLGPIERCASPGANPETGARDLPITEILYRRNGARCFGVLAKVVEGGRIAPRDLAAAV